MKEGIKQLMLQGVLLLLCATMPLLCRDGNFEYKRIGYLLGFFSMILQWILILRLVKAQSLSLSVFGLVYIFSAIMALYINYIQHQMYTAEENTVQYLWAAADAVYAWKCIHERQKIKELPILKPFRKSRKS